MLMRILLLVLLLANVVYATWQAVRDDEVGSVRTVSRPAGERVVLLAELCLRAGPFENEEAAAGFLRAAAGFGYDGRLERQEGALIRQHWVLLMDADGENEEGLQSRLGEAGIESYRITEGELAAALSVGIFSTREAASVQLERVAALGLMPVVREVERPRNELWVQLSPLEGGELQPGALQKYLEQAARVDLEENVCEMIAPLD